MTPLELDAVVLHELYGSLQQAGFDRSEALVLVGFVMVGGRDAMDLVQRLTEPQR